MVARGFAIILLKFLQNGDAMLSRRTTLPKKSDIARLSSVGKLVLLLTALVTLGVVGGCMKTAYEVMMNNPISEIKEAINQAPKKSVTLNGTFTQGLEQSVLDDGKTKYHVYDPKNLLADYAKSKGQTGVSVSVPVCIEGRVSEKGTYGHLGRYEYEVWVDKLCH